MSRPILTSTALVLVVGVVVGGCGGSDERTSATAGSDSSLAENRGPLTKEEFILAGDAICRRADRVQYREAQKYRIDHAKELDKLEPIPAEEKLIRVIVLPGLLKIAKELRALEAPKGEEEKVNAVITELEAGVTKARKNPYGIELEVGYENPLDKYIEVARDYGFNDCRNPG